MSCSVSGNLQTILEGEPVLGSVEVALCGYGSQVPRLNAATLGARVTDGMSGAQEIEVDESNGFFEFHVVGNDQIDPPTTYYTVTIRDENADIIQVNAYQFIDGTDYSLNTTDPFDPSGGPAGLPPFILNLLMRVPFAANPFFPGDQYTAWEMTLTGDTFPSFTLLTDGNLYTIIVIQDAVGGHAFNWPNNVRNATWINPDPNAITIQTFVAYNGVLYAIAAGTYYP